MLGSIFNGAGTMVYLYSLSSPLARLSPSCQLSSSIHGLQSPDAFANSLAFSNAGAYIFKTSKSVLCLSNASSH